MKDRIRIASGQGFWGDLQRAPMDQIIRGPIDYLVMDYLAEVTMSILQKQRRRNEKLGYARDLVGVVRDALPFMKEKRFRIITNGGGVNPIDCARAIQAIATEAGIDVRIGVVLGDDILGSLDDLLSKGAGLLNMETGQPPDAIRDRLQSANVYFGAWPIVEALHKGADIVITGRTTDTGLTLAPMMHEFGWKQDAWDLLAAGTVAGHVLECGGQASGGNFLGSWESVPLLEEIGFPIAEAAPDGTMVITKHPGTGGLVSSQTVKEQLLYEIGDPRSYITPDCTADFTSIQVEDIAPDRVRLSGIRGRASTDSYKVSMAYSDGFTAFGTLTYAWPDALRKARRADEILRGRLFRLGLTFDEIRTEFIGYNSSHQHIASDRDEPEEVMMRIGVRSSNESTVSAFGMEVAPLILTGPPSVTGFAGGRPKPSEVISYWPALIPKTLVAPEVVMMESGR